MKAKTVELTDLNANANYPFLYRIGERVRLKADGCKGIIKNGTFVGADHPGGAFEITYDIQTDSGETVRIPMTELEKDDSALA